MSRRQRGPTSAVRAGHFVYIVTCRDGTMYTGYTTDLPRRVMEHNSGRGSKYTRGRLPVALSHSEHLATRGDALRRELQIKGLSRSAKLLLCLEPPSSR